MEKVCMYLRKSRADIEAEDRGEGETLERHKKILFEVAKKSKINITKIFQEVVSGERIADRPQVIQLLEEIENGIWTGVLVMDIDRLGRGDTIDQGIVFQAFKFSKTKIITPNKVYDLENEFDEEYTEFNMFMARKEYKMINRRLQRGRLQSVKEGNYVGSKPPYGYVKTKLDGDFSLEPHSEQSKIVEMIFDMYTKKGMGTGLIARRLNEMKIRTQRDSLWTVSTINGIIRNPVYIGKIKWNSRPVVKTKDGKSRPRFNKEDWILVNGKHRAVIDEHTYNKAQEIMSSKGHSPKPTGELTNPLAGIVECGKCGRAMIRRPYTRQPAHIMCSNQMCENKSAKFTYVEDKIIKGLEQWLNDYKKKWELYGYEQQKDEQKIDKNILKVLNKELTELEKQKNNLHDFLERNIYTVDEYLERSKVINDRMDKTKKVIDKTNRELKEISDNKKAQENLIPKVENALSVYHKIDEVQRKNKTLKKILNKVVYTKEKHQQLDDFTLQFFPRITEK
ncbi:recombinase family protein [Chengkuizengella axinellae]|uniref:Recombinase family protein n=1 Tax=Chengkuizengella axinellae TaxID=3064388 RepID=A0ABT9J0H6_9BACL|nr:recombinase family protein [Chengkuizengella sp. 2205SS18-9]MDP5275073.1 recombinase family protein [Chengkuizengella sp. 2205SS18-9]